jgi:hypothetical protein
MYGHDARTGGVRANSSQGGSRQGPVACRHCPALVEGMMPLLMLVLSCLTSVSMVVLAHLSTLQG